MGVTNAAAPMVKKLPNTNSLLSVSLFINSPELMHGFIGD